MPTEAEPSSRPALASWPALADDGRDARRSTGGDAWQAAIFAAAIDAERAGGPAFAALYLAFLGRANGPRAGWLLASLDPAFVIGRLRQAAGVGDPPSPSLKGAA